MFTCTGTWHCYSPASLFWQSHSIHGSKSCHKIGLPHPSLTAIPKHTSFWDFPNSCLFLGNVAKAQYVPRFWDTSVFLSASEYIMQLVCICPNKTIQNFLEASSILWKYTPFVYCSYTKIRFRMGGICRGLLVQTLYSSKVSNQSCWITILQRPGPWPVQVCTPPGMQIL